jgi:hypothetical protein
MLLQVSQQLPCTQIFCHRMGSNLSHLRFLLLLLLLAYAVPALPALLPPAQLPRQARRRMTASVVAISTADASNGASVSSKSEATSTGSPTASIVQAKGSGPGTVINCEQEAKNNQTLYKECTDKRGGSGSNSGSGSGSSRTATTASTTGSASGNTTTGGTSVPWDKAPRCTKPASAYKVEKDASGNPWGWENSTSCALRWEASKQARQAPLRRQHHAVGTASVFPESASGMQ